MSDVKPLNENVLVEIIENKTEVKGVFLGENKTKPKVGKILAFSEKCENKNLEVGKSVYIGKWELIPNGDSETEFFVPEKALIAVF